MLHHCDEHINTGKDKEADKDEKKEDKQDETKENEEGEKKDEGPKDDTFQSFAVIAVSLIAMGEDIGAEMSLRQFNHLVRLRLGSLAT